MKKLINRLATAFGVLLGLSASAQEIAPLWKDYVKAKAEGRTPILPDFSYCGYHFSEKPIPVVHSQKRFDVTDFGAQPNDDKYDDEGIQQAIHAAEAEPDGGVVFFPPGKYLIADDEDASKQIRITKGNIVLKGSGRGPGGTEIFQDKMRIGGRQFLFKPAFVETYHLANIFSDVPRESFWVEVDNVDKLKKGQTVVIRHRSEAYTEFYFSPLTLNTQWSRLFGPEGGMVIQEIHLIDSIVGSKVKFKNPVHLDIKIIGGKPFEVHSFVSIRECGVEDILFTGNWKSYPEEFVHHKNSIHDNAWQALGMEYVEDSWVRNCEFRDFNDCLFMRAAFRITVINTIFSGKKGHTSLHARAGNGVLIKNCHFNGSHHHGPGTGYGGVNTVVTQCTMGVDQNIDSHSGQPFATLFDQIDGGVFTNLGGPLPGLPHHGKDLVMWNFKHRATKDFHYNFWDLTRRRNYTIARPVFVGFQADTDVTFENEAMNQLPGTKVFPASLFEAQLKLRLSGENDFE